MPTYPYRCNGCGHRFSTMQRITDPKLKDCPACGDEKLERLITGGGGVVKPSEGLDGEKGDVYREKARIELAMSHPEKFDRLVEKERGSRGKS